MAERATSARACVLGTAPDQVAAALTESLKERGVQSVWTCRSRKPRPWTMRRGGSWGSRRTAWRRCSGCETVRREQWGLPEPATVSPMVLGRCRRLGGTGMAEPRRRIGPARRRLGEETRQGSVMVVEPLDRQREWSMPLDFWAAVWSGSGMHTDTPTIRGRAVPPWAPAREVRPVRPAKRAAWRTLMATHHYWGVRGVVGESLG